MRFRRWMRLLIFSFSLIPTIVVMIICSVTFSSRFGSFVQRNLSYDADLFAKRIEAYMNDGFKSLDELKDHQLTHILLTTHADSSHTETQFLLAALDTELDAFMQSHPEVMAIYIVDKDKQIVSFVDPLFPARSSLLSDPDSIIDVATFRAASSRSAPNGAIQDKPYIFLSTPIVGEPGHQGTIIAALDILPVNRIANETGLFDSGFRLVFDQNGDIMAISGDKSAFRSIGDLSERSNLDEVLSSYNYPEEPVGTISFELDGRPHSGRYRYLEPFGFTVLTGIDKREFFRPLLDAIPLYLAITSLFIVVLILAINWISNKIGRPVQSLIEGMNHVKEHDYQYHIPLVRADAFETMIESFNSLMEQVAHDTAELKRLNTELDSLMTNIPGGLFTCTLEPGLPFVSASESFARLIGCRDREALVDFSNNRFLNTVHPLDRPTVETVLSAAGSASFAGSFEYRTLQDAPNEWIACSFRILVPPEGETISQVYFVATDATEKHRAFEQLRTSDERYRIILEQTDEVLFEWSVVESKFLYYSRDKNWMNMFGVPFPQDADLMAGIFFDMHGPDRVRFVAKMKEMVAFRIKSTRIEVRLSCMDAQGPHPVWTRFLLSSMFDDRGKVERIVGRVQNINEEKLESQRLIGLSQTDSLTSLMNRRGFQASVTRILEIADMATNRHVLVMLDVDDFKQINDSYGHSRGDEVLARIAGHLRQTFRATDLFSRLGGDEFAIFLVNFQDTARLMAKTEDLLFRLRSDGLSCSIGIACFPEHGTTFHQLYQSADMALYSVKKRGKNDFSMVGSS